MTSRPWLRRLLSFLLIAAAFGFLAREIIRNLDSLRAFDWRLQPWTLLFSVAALVVVLVFVLRLLPLRNCRGRRRRRAWVGGWRCGADAGR